MPGSEREIRLAVVMYGGTSLAIYMNGISREFLELVRATSPAATEAQALGSTARVYRKLAHVLAGTPLDAITDEVLARPPRVRFVIDILSGTSAGGINAVMLAKALAQNTDLEPLKQLWLSEGAIETLINDRGSASQRYPYREPVRAVFNSDRMYVELLRAMEGLNRKDGSTAAPLVSDVALAVTGTDLTGQPIDIRLADGVAQEYDHKHVFEFRLSWPEIDEFGPEFDPLLAFAARTTSSLPAVFEPATVPAARTLAGERRAGDAPWPLLFRGLRAEDRARHEQHAFADGGYLDNKPFGHAIDRLAKAKVGVHVTRKLYYLEPQPQRIDPDAPPAATPSAIETTLKGVSLARYETIRSDIARLVERNRLIDRVRTLGLGVLEDLGRAAVALPEGDDLRALIAAHGPAYGGYHRLRVATLTDELAGTIADQARVAPASDIRRALRWVVRAWRNTQFARDAAPPRTSEVAFLRRFDVSFQRRRAVFLLDKINQLFHLTPDVVRELENVIGSDAGASDRYPALAALVAQYRGAGRAQAEAAWGEMDELFRVAKTLAQRAVVALDPERPAPGDGDGLSAAVQQLEPRRRQFRDELLAILGQPSEDAANAAAGDFLERHRGLVEELAGELERHQRGRVDTAIDALSDLEKLAVPAGLESEVRALLELYWECFVYFDMVQFPLVEATGVGEERSPIEMHRMSPFDCPHYRAFGETKLLGTRFASFGAFLDRRWRESDIRWGRLDGAERLIATLLGHEHGAAREQLVVEAHLAIVREEFPADGAAIDGLVARLDDGRGGAALDPSVTRHNTERFLVERAVAAELDPRASATTLSRLLRTSNKLVDTLTTESRAPGLVRNALAFTSLAGSELLDAAIPKSFKHLLVSYWANLLLLFGALLVVLGLVLPSDSPWGGGTRLGFLLVTVAVAALFARSLAWRALAPPAGVTPTAMPWTRVVGLAALLVGLVVVSANVLLEASAARSPRQDLIGYPSAALAMEFARTADEVACILGVSTSAEACVAPAGVPTGPGVDTMRSLIYVDFAFIALYLTVLGVIALAALRGPHRWRGLLGLALALAAAGLDVWENARILRTVTLDLGQLEAAWLLETARIARAKFLAAFAAVAVLLPVLTVHARTAPLNLRAFAWLLALLGAIGVTLGLLGLVLDYPVLLGYGVGLLAVVMLGIAFLLLMGYFGVRRTVGVTPANGGG
jgi:patatin-related protein